MTFTIHFMYYVGIIHVITYLSFIQSKKLFDTRVINRVILAKKLIIRQPFLFLSTILNPWGKMEFLAPIEAHTILQCHLVGSE